MKRSLFLLLFLKAFLFLTALTALAEESLPPGNYKYDNLLSIYQQIARAMGDINHAPPLYLRPKRLCDDSLCWYEPIRKCIFFEETLYDYLTTLGEDSTGAMAFLLGHELAHHYKNHVWVYDFKRSFADKQNINITPVDVKKRESEADDMGFFYSEVAGYNSINAAQKTIFGVYEHDELIDDTLVKKGYLPKDKRAEVANMSAKKAENLYPIFKAGVNLWLLGKYELAALCFEKIAKEFPSKELWNNVGAAKALIAMELFDKDSIKFQYPLQIDVDSRLSDIYLNREFTAKGTGTESPKMLEVRRNKLLNESKQAFEESIKIDPQYFPAYLNLACVEELLNERDLSKGHAKEALKLKHIDKIDSTNIFIIIGIAEFNDDNKQKAKNNFLIADTASSKLALINYKIVDGEKLDINSGQEKSKETTSTESEELQGFDVYNYRDNFNFITNADTLPRVLENPGASNMSATIYFKDTLEINLILVKTEDKQYFFISTNPRFGGANKNGLKIGMTNHKAIKIYGEPEHIVELRYYKYFIYDYNSIIIQLDKNNNINGWTLYKVNE